MINLEKPKKVKITKGRYKGLSGVLVMKFKTFSLIRTPETNKGGRYQKHFGGWIIKAQNSDYIENKN